MRIRSKQGIAFLLKAAVTALLFALLFAPERLGLRADFWGAELRPDALWNILRDVDARHLAWWLAAAAGVKCCGMLAGTLRWSLLLRGQAIRLPFWSLFQSWLVGRFIGIAMPGTLGLDGYRLYDSGRRSGRWVSCAAVIGVEKLTGFIALTTLVLLTLPLGRDLIQFKPAVLAVTLLALGVVLAVALSLLLTPHALRILAAILPAPGRLRGILDRVAASLGAYSGQRTLLLAALGLGVAVHAATCLMYFCTMSAIRAPQTSLGDILFTSPLMIWGTVLGPSVGGEGIREAVFTRVLGAQSGVPHAFLMAHLGWWTGEVVPFLMGAAVFAFRRNRERLAPLPELHEPEPLSVEHVRRYRRHVIDALCAGASAGLCVGVVVALGEAAWLTRILPRMAEYWLWLWGPAFYGTVFALGGVGLAGALGFATLLRGRALRKDRFFGLNTGLLLALGIVAIGLFRYYRDILGKHAMVPAEGAAVLLTAAMLGVTAAWLSAQAYRRMRLTRGTLAVAAAGFWVVVCAAGALIPPFFHVPPTASTSVAASAAPSAPNIIFIALDACRADAISLFSQNAAAHTPNLEHLARDGVTFTNAFAQAPWTKPSFATVFTGLPPNEHGATSQNARIAVGAPRLAALLAEQGYTTWGLANNPNLRSAYGFEQGFAQYIELEPERYFGASSSAAQMVLYEVLRRAHHQLEAFLRGGYLRATDFYQPADIVTQQGLALIEARAEALPRNPFFLFLHYMDTHDPFMDHERPGVGYARVRLGEPDPQKYLKPMQHAYRSELEYFDAELGGLLDGLARLDVYDDSLIVFFSDHGEEFFDHNGWWHGRTLYDEVLHVPLIVKAPKRLRAGEQMEGLVQLLDLAPTALAWAACPQPSAMRGLPLITPDGALTPGHARIYAENDFEGNELRGVRTPTEKLVLANPGNPRGVPERALFDLVNDPTERTNIVDSTTARAEELETLLKSPQEGATPPPAPAAPLAPAAREQLKSLGYL